MQTARWLPYRAQWPQIAIAALLVATGWYLILRPPAVAQGASDVGDVPEHLQKPAEVTPPAPAEEPATVVLLEPEPTPEPEPEPTPEPEPKPEPEPEGMGRPIKSVTSSRHYPKHPPTHLIDGRLDTAWQSRRRRKRKLWVEVDLGIEQTVAALELANGCQAEGQFELNARARVVHVIFDGGKTIPVELDPSVQGFVRFDLEPRTTRYVRVRLRRYQWGSKYHRDVCLSEIRVFGPE